MEKFGHESAERIMQNSRGFCSVIFVAIALLFVTACSAFFDLTEYTGILAPNGNDVSYSINDIAQTPVVGYTEKGILANVGDTLNFKLTQNGSSDTTYFVVPIEKNKSFRIDAIGSRFLLSK
jgi:hypothetical protein